MKKSQHTSEPWELVGKSIMAGKVYVAEINHETFDSIDVDNARLITAAPDMLKALTALKPIIDREGIGTNPAESERACELMGIALAKAKGE